MNDMNTEVWHWPLLMTSRLCSAKVLRQDDVIGMALTSHWNSVFIPLVLQVAVLVCLRQRVLRPLLQLVLGPVLGWSEKQRKHNQKWFKISIYDIRYIIHRFVYIIGPMHEEKILENIPKIPLALVDHIYLRFWFGYSSKNNFMTFKKWSPSL